MVEQISHQFNFKKEIKPPKELYKKQSQNYRLGDEW